jgi:hypothetical protein
MNKHDTSGKDQNNNLCSPGMFQRILMQKQFFPWGDSAKMTWEDNIIHHAITVIKIFFLQDILTVVEKENY